MRMVAIIYREILLRRLWKTRWSGALTRPLTEFPEPPSIAPNGEYYSYTDGGAISFDGRFVSFTSSDDRSVLLRDMTSGKTERISLGLSGELPNDFSFSTAVSADGSAVVYASLASNLVVGDTNHSKDTFLWRRGLGTTLLSRAPNGLAANGNSDNPTISADGAVVAFQSDASNLIPNSPSPYFIFSVGAQKLSAIPDITKKNVLAPPYGPAVISGEGMRIFFSAGVATDLSGNVISTEAAGHVFVYDRRAGVTKILERTTGGSHPNGIVRHLSPSFDGDRLAFASSSSNLDPGDLDGVGDIFAFDGISAALTIQPTPSPTPTPTPTPTSGTGSILRLSESKLTGRVGRSFKKRLRSDPPGATFKLGKLPNGLRYDNRGTIAGTPRRKGSTNIPLRLSRAGSDVAATLTITITR